MLDKAVLPTISAMSLVGVADALAALVAEREGECRGKVLRVGNRHRALADDSRGK